MTTAGLWTQAALAALLSGGLVACASTAPKTLPPTTASVEVERELRHLEERWEILPLRERKQLEPELVQFIERHGTDPGVSRARLLLGRLWLDEGRYAPAEEVLAPVLAGPRSRVRDEALVVQAALDNRLGRHERALDRLDPLRGKLFSAEARELHARERARAALGARRWRVAVDALVDWLSTSQRRKEAEAWVRGALSEVPSSALRRILLDWSEERKRAEPRTPSGEWVERVVIERLANETLAARSPRWARDLLLHSPSWLRTSEVGDQLALLAALVSDEANSAGRVIGLVLGGATSIERRRGVKFAAGLIDGLGLATREDRQDKIHIVTEENRGSMGTALASLSGQGASLLVAGTDAEGAEVALAFAESRKIPLLSLSAPARERADMKYGFVFGEGEARQHAELAKMLAANRAVAAPSASPSADSANQETETLKSFVVLGASACEPRLTRPGLARFPIAEWDVRGVTALLLLGDAGCALRVTNEARAMHPRPLLGLGLEAADGPFPRDFEGWFLGAGRFPSAVRPLPQDRVSSAAKTLEEADGWFEALGRDLARLLSNALRHLPDTQVFDEKEVEARHESIRRALLEAEEDLETTEARGFAGKHRIQRTLRLHPIGAPRPHAAPPPALGTRP